MLTIQTHPSFLEVGRGRDFKTASFLRQAIRILRGKLVAKKRIRLPLMKCHRITTVVAHRALEAISTLVVSQTRIAKEVFILLRIRLVMPKRVGITTALISKGILLIQAQPVRILIALAFLTQGAGKPITICRRI